MASEEMALSRTGSRSTIAQKNLQNGGVHVRPYESKYYYSYFKKCAVPDWFRNGMAFL